MKYGGAHRLGVFLRRLVARFPLAWANLFQRHGYSTLSNYRSSLLGPRMRPDYYAPERSLVPAPVSLYRTVFSSIGPCKAALSVLKIPHRIIPISIFEHSIVPFNIRFRVVAFTNANDSSYFPFLFHILYFLSCIF